MTLFIDGLTHMRKLIGLLSLFMAMLLTSCGGGGGYAGDTGPTNALRMSPVLSGVTLPVDYFSDVAIISQGVKPYHVLSSDPSVRAVLLDDNTLRVYAVQPGSSTVAVQDSSVKQTSISMTVTVKVSPLSSSIGNALTLAPRQSQSFTISGGGAPYTVMSNNPSVATVSEGANGTYTITAGSMAGTAGIVVTDSYGTTLTVTVTVVIAQALSASPTTVTGVAGTSANISIFGGVAPYSVTSSNPSVASVTLAGSMATVNLLSAGSSTLTIRDDSSAAPVSVTVTVTAPPPKFLVIPPTQNLTETPGTTTGLTTVDYQFVNGTGPYYATLAAADEEFVSAAVTTVTAGTGTGATSSTVLRVTRIQTGGAYKCVTSPRTIPITVTDAATMSTSTINVVILNDNAAACP